MKYFIILSIGIYCTLSSLFLFTVGIGNLFLKNEKNIIIPQINTDTVSTLFLFFIATMGLITGLIYIYLSNLNKKQCR